MSRTEDGECPLKISSQSSWKTISSLPYTLKHFVRESRTDEVLASSTSVNDLLSSFSGKECREAYEEVLAVPSENSFKVTKKKEIVRTPVDSRPWPQQYCLNNSQGIDNLMREASANNVERIKNLLGEGKDINVTDQFGWTMLMCACHAGAVDVVKYLLENSADERIKDKSGYTCISLAKRQKHSAILCLFNKQPEQNERKLVFKEETTQVFCDVCQGCYTDSPSRRHRNSTVHLFNSHPHKHTTWYGIPDNNKGFELMIKNGWDRERGLGPEGSGTKFPMKTILKRDRKGFGIGSGVARVTHFKPCDIQAVEFKRERKIKNIKKAKTSRKSEVTSEKRKERYLRRELNF